MKIISRIVAVLFMISLVYGQETVPKPVLKTFASKFPDAENVKWEAEGNHAWEAEFHLDGKEVSVCFDTSGKWLETETEICKKDLPAEIYRSLFLRFEGFEIDEAESIKTPDFNGYEIVLEKHDTEVEIFITASGEITIQDVIVEEEDEDDD